MGMPNLQPQTSRYNHHSDHLVLRSDLLPPICTRQSPKVVCWERVASPHAWSWQGSGSSFRKTLAHDRTRIPHTTSTKQKSCSLSRKCQRNTSTTLLISCCYGTKSGNGILLNDHAGHSPCLPVCYRIVSASKSVIITAYIVVLNR